MWQKTWSKRSVAAYSYVLAHFSCADQAAQNRMAINSDFYSLGIYKGGKKKQINK